MPTPILGLPYPTSADTADVPRDIKALADKIDPLGVVPVGALMMWPTAAPPNSAWLICDGHPVLVADYPLLATVLGSAGGQITLPNLQNRVPIGPGENPLLAQGGAKETTLTAPQLPAHSHPVANQGQANSSGSHSHGGRTDYNEGSMQHRHAPFPGYYFMGTHSPGLVVALNTTGNLADPAYLVAMPSNTPDNTVGSLGSTGDLIGSIEHRHPIIADGAHTHALSGVAVGDMTGGGAAHSNEQRFLVVNFIIRAL